MDIKQKIGFWGDSITLGMGDIEFDKGWVGMLNDILISKNYNIDILNFGVGGETSSGLLNRIKSEIINNDVDMAFIAIGINDSKYRIIRDSSHVNVEQFRRNLEDIAMILRDLKIQSIFIGLTNVDENKVCPISSDWSVSFDNKNIDIYNFEINKVAIKFGFDFISLKNVLSKADLYDGLHPNSEGYKKIASKISKYIIKKGILNN